MELAKATPRIYEKIMQSSPAIIIPVGSMEWHDTHLPFGLDFLKLDRICGMIADKIGKEGCFVAPTMQYGYPKHISTHPTKSIGTFCPTFEPLYNFIFEIGKMYVDKGFRVIYFISGHYERSQIFMLKLISRRLVDYAREKGIEIDAECRMEPDFTIREGISKMWKEDPASESCQLPYYPGDHAGFYETSLALYLFPEVVHFDEIKPVYYHPTEGEPSANWGKIWCDMIIAKASKEIEEMLKKISEIP